MAEKAIFPFEGYTLYVVVHKGEGGRKMANLVKNTKDRTTISYARYLMSVHLGRLLDKDEHVDHINGDCTDDRIENYQILTEAENRRKYNIDNPASLIELSCPICGSNFTRSKQKAYQFLRFGKEVCCSKSVGGSRWLKLLKQQIDNS